MAFSGDDSFHGSYRHRHSMDWCSAQIDEYGSYLWGAAFGLIPVILGGLVVVQFKIPDTRVGFYFHTCRGPKGSVQNRPSFQRDIGSLRACPFSTWTLMYLTPQCYPYLVRLESPIVQAPKVTSVPSPNS